MVHLKWNGFCFRGEGLHLVRVRVTAGSLVPHNHDYYECFFVESGPGIHCDRSGSTRLEPGTMVFIRPEHAHSFRAPRTGEFRILNVAISATVFEAFLGRHGGTFPGGAWKADAPPAMWLVSPAQRAEWARIAVLLESGGRSGLDAEWFLSSMARLAQATPPAATGLEIPAWLRAATSGDACRKTIAGGLPALVQACGRSPEHVAREFRRYFGQTPTQWVHSIRLQQACVLLETTDLSVTEVAVECGIENLSFFHRTFRGKYGKTPRQFRLATHGMVHPQGTRALPD